METANAITIFNSEEFGEVRTIIIDDEPWFVGKDVAAALGYGKTADAIRQHVEEDDKLTRCFMESGQNRQMYIINEPGLYALVFGSKLDSAKRFKHWVTHEVIPSIRKTGSYSLPNAPTVTPDMLVSVQNDLTGAITSLSQQVQEIKIQQDILTYTVPHPTFTYEQCLPKNPKDMSIFDRRKAGNDIATKIYNIAGYTNIRSVFAKIYHLMKEAYNIDMEQQVNLYMQTHRTLGNISPFSVIINSSLLFNCFMNTANEMLERLSIGEPTGNSFSEILSYIPSIAYNKFGSNTLSTYKNIYKQMEDKDRINWSSYNGKSKLDKIKSSTDLQLSFTKYATDLFNS